MTVFRVIFFRWQISACWPNTSPATVVLRWMKSTKRIHWNHFSTCARRLLKLSWFWWSLVSQLHRCWIQVGYLPLIPSNNVRKLIISIGSDQKTFAHWTFFAFCAAWWAFFGYPLYPQFIVSERKNQIEKLPVDGQEKIRWKISAAKYVDRNSTWRAATFIVL